MSGGSLSEEAYSDDEDVSWKVRRGAAKVLSVIIIQYPDLLPDLYQELCLELVGRFREREENVKGDVFAAFVDLLRQIADVARRSGADSSAAVGVLAQLQVGHTPVPDTSGKLVRALLSLPWLLVQQRIGFTSA